VPNETIKGYPELALISTGLKFDVHLMVRNPLGELFHWSKENIDRFIVHIESEDITAVIKEIRNMGKNVGLTLNQDTSVSSIEPFVGLVDFIQFMTVNPGFQGGDFLDHVVEKIRSFRKKYPEVVIAVDGGVNPTTAKSVIEAGASILVSGSFILKSGNVGKAIEELKKISENTIIDDKSAS
jgi:ribulose-phosphate 3-epimerase